MTIFLEKLALVAGLADDVTWVSVRAVPHIFRTLQQSRARLRRVRRTRRLRVMEVVVMLSAHQSRIVFVANVLLAVLKELQHLVNTP